MKRSPQPPGVWQTLLRLVLRPDCRDAVLGDLREEFLTHVLPRHGPAAARRWYAGQVLRSLVPLAGRRFIGAAGPRAERRIHSRRRDSMMMSLMQDLRYAVRGLRRLPGFTAVVVATLALGIGANTAIFSVVNGILLQPLPYDEPADLVRIWGWRGGERTNVSPQDFLDWRESNQTLSGMSAYTASGYATVTTPAGPTRVRRGLVTAELFTVLGIRASLGRTFDHTDEDIGEPLVTAVSHQYWQRELSADPQIVGTTLRIDGGNHIVIGVLPATFRFLDYPFTDHPDVWLPLRITPRMGRGGHWLQALGRLSPETPMARARTDLQAIAERLEASYPESNTGRSVVLEPLHQSLVGETRTPLLILSGAVGLVLLIACTNVASLMLARGTVRQRELALRAALGASRARVMRLLLTESMVLALLGGAVGIVFAYGTTTFLLALGRGLPRAGEIGIDGSVLVFTLGLSVVTGLLFGLAPAITSSASRGTGSLHDHLRGSADGRSGHRLRALFLMVETALTIVLLVGAGLLLQSFARLSSVDPGLDPRNVLTAEVVLPPAYDSRAAIGAFYEELLPRIRALPGILEAGAVNNIPFKYNSCDGFSVDDRPPPPPGEGYCAYNQLATPGYFRAMGIEILQGRGFAVADGPNTVPVVVVNDVLARRFWPDESPIGKRLTYNARSWEIVGVVRSVRRRGLDRDAEPEMIFPHRQDSWDRQMILTMRTAGDPTAMVPAVRAAVRDLDRRVPLGQIDTMAQLVTATYAAPRFRTLVLTLFAAVALALSAVGIYGVVTYSVAQRTREIGVRIALGAGRADVLTAVTKHSLTVTGVGVVLGLSGAAGVAHVLDSLLYGITARDLPTFAVVPVVLGVIALAAGYLPAARAMRVDPVEALKEG